MDIDNLFGKNKVWWDSLTVEAREVIDDIARACNEKKREPNWAEVLRAFTVEFPGQAPRTESTIQATIQRRQSLV